MKHQHLKLAGIVTVVCGGMSSLGAGAVGSDSPTIATGQIQPMSNASEVTEGRLDAGGQDSSAVAQNDLPDIGEIREVTAVTQSVTPDVVDPVRPVLATNDELAPVMTAPPDRSPAQDELSTPANKAGPVAPPVVFDDGHELNASGALEKVVVPVEASVGLNAVHAVHMALTPAPGRAQTGRAALQLGDTANLTSASATQRDDADPAWASADVVAVNDNRLDTMRGGFDLPSGLVVSFGISRAAFVNGALVASTSFNIPNIAQMTPQQAQMLASANTGALIQNGLNNTVQPGALPGMTGAVIQNTLSNQQIQALTTINTTVNSLAAFKALNLGQTLNMALLSAVRPR
ncbi:hypothetical protein R75461_08435 [Paraburkholderia nemoris]|uniref:hypothetical protein n=1 Tax=Paraburkholderia nemoris TaxID=2793076 RepID=UPI00190BC92F|nr:MULTISPECIES: hypothetical protein [Paraburkholderia]MBK3787162.1 hypothetical protein [Paraburkholderia aspalathi]CAE6868539.1 hypothetical protein R75461_08435 [Paraburkholderia nemoris]